LKFLIVTGMSGAGKSRAAAVLEDIDFYCVDNMPAALMPKFAELCLATRGRYERVALVSDIRGGDSFDELFKALDYMNEIGCECEMLFMDAEDEVLINRYKETRRRHPLATEGMTLKDAVARERKLLEPLRERADYVIDTSTLHTSRLQRELYRLFGSADEEHGIKISVVSFGFKYGIPSDADLVFDVRFMPNPYYISGMRYLTGLDERVNEYVFAFTKSTVFMDKLIDMLTFLMPLYVEEGKRSLVIAVGCTGGRHRSVAVARKIAEKLQEAGYNAEDSHRDMEKG